MNMKLIELLEESYKNGLVTGVVGSYSYKVVFNKEKVSTEYSNFEAQFHDTSSCAGSFRIQFSSKRASIEITSSMERFIDTEISVDADAFVEMELSDICDKITHIAIKIESLLSLSEDSFIQDF